MYKESFNFLRINPRFLKVNSFEVEYVNDWSLRVYHIFTPFADRLVDSLKSLCLITPSSPWLYLATGGMNPIFAVHTDVRTYTVLFYLDIDSRLAMTILTGLQRANFIVSFGNWILNLLRRSKGSSLQHAQNIYPVVAARTLHKQRR